MQSTSESEGDLKVLPDALSISSSLSSSDPLVLKVVKALRQELGDAILSVHHCMEMKHVLLLLVKAFHDLCDGKTYQRSHWLTKMRETVGLDWDSPINLRERAGIVVIRMFEDAPWGIQKRPGQDRSHTVHTILAFYRAMVDFVRQLETELKKKEEETGVVDLEEYDVEDMKSLEEDDEKDEPILTSSRLVPVASIIDTAINASSSTITTILPAGIAPASAPSTAIGDGLQAPNIIKPGPTSSLNLQPTINTSTAPETTNPAFKLVKSSKRIKSNGEGPGNHEHGQLTTWRRAEHLHMLKLYRDNPDNTAKQIAQKHNSGYWAAQARNVERSADGIRQQYKRILGAGTKDQTRGRLHGKIAELEGAGGYGAPSVQSQGVGQQMNGGDAGNENDE